MSRRQIFADVTSVREYDLPSVDDDFRITLRKELSVGERRRAFADAIKGQTPNDDGTVRTDYDHAKLSFGIVMAYLVDWSDPMPVSRDAVAALLPEVYQAIEDVVNKHAEEYGPTPPKRQSEKAIRTRKASGEAISLSVAK